MSVSEPLRHGGDLERAEQEFGIARSGWLDLSTGISPWSWPLPPVPEYVWRTLPDSGRELAAAAASYYQVPLDTVQPVAGSQIAIQQLPALFAQGVVAIPAWGYQEHRKAWQRQGHRVVEYHGLEALQQLVASSAVNYAVVINPNNPTGELCSTTTLIAIQKQLAIAGGCLVVDEAFMDTSPQHSLLPLGARSGLVVLRSLGKFFGLAGLRVGFAIATPALLKRLAETLPPWMISHPSSWLAQRALRDIGWQQQQNQRLAEAAQSWQPALVAQLPQLQFANTGSSPLFMTGFGGDAECQQLYRALARLGVLVRIFEPRLEGGQRVNALRFGLPETDNLSRALAALKSVAGNRQDTVCRSEKEQCVTD